MVQRIPRRKDDDGEHLLRTCYDGLTVVVYSKGEGYSGHVQIQDAPVDTSDWLWDVAYRQMDKMLEGQPESPLGRWLQRNG